MTPSTPKTHVLLASAAPIAVIFYRKSHLTTYCLHLDYARIGNGFRYRLTRGSRFYGRLFPHRSELSPDGSLLVYFAMRGRMTGSSADPTTWTALCTPPWLKAHLFFPNGSTWGGGGMFLRDHRLVVFDGPVEGAGPEYSNFRGYEIVKDTKSLPEKERAMIMVRFRPPAEVYLPQPAGVSRRTHLLLVRRVKPHTPDNYDFHDYVLQDNSGKDIEGAEEIVLANWAGWDNSGRLLVASGRHLKFYEVEPRKPLPKPMKILDLETVINGIT